MKTSEKVARREQIARREGFLAGSVTTKLGIILDLCAELEEQFDMMEATEFLPGTLLKRKAQKVLKDVNELYVQVAQEHIGYFDGALQTVLKDSEGTLGGGMD